MDAHSLHSACLYDKGAFDTLNIYQWDIMIMVRCGDAVESTIIVSYYYLKYPKKYYRMKHMKQ